MIEESFSSFTVLSRNLQDQLEMEKAKRKVAKELRRSLEKLEKSIANISLLRKELKTMQDKMTEAEAKLKKKKKLLISEK